MIRLFRKRREKRFWAWFKQNEAALFAAPLVEQSSIVDAVEHQLARINPLLMFEFGAERDGRRDFVISADGIKDAVPNVRLLIAAAPRLDRWRFIAFRQPMVPPGVLTFKGLRLDPREVRAGLIREGAKIGIDLFYPGVEDASDPALRHAGLLLLDSTLGEEAMLNRVGSVAHASMSEAPPGGLSIPVAELPGAFRALLERMERGT